MARISTHILDIARGKPAEGIVVQLYRGLEMLRVAKTNADGRTDEPLLLGETIQIGAYELQFRVGDYLPQPAFFEVITVSFVVTDERGNYHVPLLLAPHGYSTYRGS
ncbi:MAG TPA: hydroxyisourate hydrolase [Bryobacteraceae bacterium]|nr:hydroxyisourate hydrolase [Bryobacteraceae bacterium]